MRYTGLMLIVLSASASAMAAEPQRPQVGQRLDRVGDEIMVCGQLFHTTTRVVLWTDPGGYDAYRVEKRFGPPDQPLPKNPTNASERGTQRYGVRTRGLTPEQLNRVRGGGWDLPLLQQVVDQFVIHYDVCGTSARCFQVLQDLRGLSVHFMLDVDGRIYQTLDLKEAAWHATKANGRSVGIEIANMGAYPPGKPNPLGHWYRADADGKVRLVDPQAGKAVGFINPELGLRPARNEKIVGTIHGTKYEQYDLTPQQYEALTKLTATLCSVFPKIRCDCPRDKDGKPLARSLSNEEYRDYHGVLGHYHVQRNKQDPGPAFQWDRVLTQARGLMGK